MSIAKKVKWEPLLWKEQLENIRKMRIDLDAPVDTMGCDAVSSVNKLTTPKEKRLCVLLSLMLSSQTKDEITSKAVEKLRENINPFNVDTLINISDEELGKCIYPCSFWKTKTKHIKKSAIILKDKYDGDIPDTVEKLCQLPGVGPKMAYITMSVAWNNTVGIGVDTHVHRIANRLGWTKKLTKLPDQTRKELEDWLPNQYWDEINLLLVGFGQQICKSMKPKCNECLNQAFCPFAQKKT